MRKKVTSPQMDVESSMPEVSSEPRHLTALDRCDCCSARAYVEVAIMTQTGPSALLFCGHHFTEYESSLREAAAAVNDQRCALAER